MRDGRDDRSRVAESNGRRRSETRLLRDRILGNGTLGRVTGRAVRICRGHAGLLPIMFFGLGLVISTIGPGATPSSALLAPPSMAVAARAGVPPFLMAIMAGNGALAGTLSPFAPTGIVAHGVMQRIGLGGVEWQTYAYNAFAHALVGGSVGLSCSAACASSSRAPLERHTYSRTRTRWTSRAGSPWPPLPRSSSAWPGLACTSA
ncbi:MAG: hypothetical protein ABR606_08065 [Vicinamibacterales bacterium]